MSNSQEFLNAAATAKKLANTPTTEELKVLYGFYKQAVFGDCNVEKPSFFDFKEKAKWESWNSNKGTCKYDSEVKYICYVNELIQKYGIGN
jgi:diazepam-binding inhibitor (GABA receptor modulating acyl-CoA-binding protein)